MIVVSGTSPINYFVLTELQELLPELFDRILILVAAERKLINLEDALGRLQKASFRVSPRLLKSIRDRKRDG